MAVRGPRSSISRGRSSFHSDTDENPFGENGLVTQLAEHIPIINNITQEVHQANGRENALRRSQDRNPLGADGIVTQAFEHIPIICDGIEYIHRSNGHELSAERASARTLTRLFSKDGAVTRVAELLPGSNLVAAAVHAMNGNHNEAERALNLFDSWTQAGDPDGALAKVAELFPGTDLVAFALHMQSNQFAQALRCVCKTTWVNIEVDRVILWVNAPKVKDIAVNCSEIRGVDANPRCLSLIVGLNDIFASYLEVDRRDLLRPNINSESSLSDDWTTITGIGEGLPVSSFYDIHNGPSSYTSNVSSRRRDSMPSLMTPRGHRRRNSRSYLSTPRSNPESEGSNHDFIVVGVETEELLTDWANDYIAFIIDRLILQIPTVLHWAIESVNTYTLPRWRSEALRYKVLFRNPKIKPFPPLDVAVTQAFQTSFPFFSIYHTPFLESDSVKLPWIRPRSRLRRIGYPVAGAAACLTGAAGCGVKAAGLACMAGFLVGARQLCRYLYRRAHNHFDTYNQESWAAAALRREAQGSEPQDPSVTRDRKWGVMLKFPEAGGNHIVCMIWDYVLRNLRCGCILAPCFHCHKPLMKAAIRHFVPEWQTVPFVMDVETGDICLEVDHWPNGLRLPNLRVAVLVDLGLSGETPSQVRVAVPDTVVNEIVETLRQQIGELDMRTMDPRLSDFTQPFRLQFNAHLEWPRVDKAKLVLEAMKAQLHLPS